jgi:hypothetical protein
LPTNTEYCLLNNHSGTIFAIPNHCTEFYVFIGTIMRKKPSAKRIKMNI